MTHKSYFSSSHSALILGLGVLASATFAGVTFAQSLIIPTSLDNAVITIKKIFLSDNGVKTDANGASIVLDGTDGYMYLKNNDFMSQCNNTTGCVLKVGTNGKVTLTTNVTPWLGQDEQVSVFKRTSASDPTNIMLAKSDGTESVVGPASNQSILRVGATNNNITINGGTRQVSKPDTAMIVAGTVEARGNLLLRKAEGTTLGNVGNNLKANLSNGYTQLDVGITDQKIDFKTSSRSFFNDQYETNMVFSNSDGLPLKVGVNTPAGSLPQANLQVDNNGTFFVGRAGCFLADTKVTMADGSSKAIQDIKVGEQIKSVDGTNTVLSLLHPILGDQPVYAINNNDAFFTANHPFLTTEGWKSIDPETTKKEIPDLEITKLSIGDVLITEQGKVLVMSLNSTTRPADTQLYNFSLDGDHTYFADGYAVHNKQDCSGELGTCPNKLVGSLYANGTSNKVGIHTIDPQKTLDVNGTASISDNLIIGHLSNFDPGSDKLAVNGSTRANAYYYNSDRRYKSDIEVLKSPLENLLKLSGYSYFNKLSDKKDLGVIAQEVEKVYPELVQTDADGYKSVEYGNLVAPLIEAIKELSHKVDNLTTKIGSLYTMYISQQAKIDTLEARLQALESKVK